MAEISTAAYTDLRNYIQTNWKYIELQDGSGTPVVRLSPADQKVTWTHTIGASVLKLQIIIKGSDITAPKTIAKSAIFNVATGGIAYSVESFTAFTLETAEDELTVIHSIQVPKV